MSSNEDQSARRDSEEKETGEVEVGGETVEGGENEAVGGGGDDPAAGGGGGSVRIGVLGSSTYTDPFLHVLTCFGQFLHVLSKKVVARFLGYFSNM